MIELEGPNPPSPEPDKASQPDQAGKPPVEHRDTYDVQDGHEAHVAPGPAIEVAPGSPAPGSPAPGSPRNSVLLPPPPSPEPEGPTWPDSIGSVCMLLAGCGLLIHALVLTGYTLDLTDGWKHLWRDKPAPSYWELIPNMMLETVLLCVELMLLYGGLAMKMRWISAVATLRTWAKVKIVLVLLRLLRDWAVLVVPVYKLIMQKPPDSTWGHYQTGFMVGWSLVMLAWGLLLPLFLLAWFRRGPVKEELATW